MIIKASCPCGNTVPDKDGNFLASFAEYHGMLGYEAIICKKCGRYSDHSGSYEADDFSKHFITK